MGNRASASHLSASSGDKTQATGGSTLYELADLHGGGKIIDQFRLIYQSDDPLTQSNFNQFLRNTIKPFLYNDGHGKLVPVSTLVEERENYRLGGVRKTKRKLLQYKKYYSMTQIIKDQHDIDPGSLEHDEHGNPCRLVCWDIARRGSVGENIVHLCLLLNNPFHTDLARRIIAVFPKLAMDIYLGDEYYGEGPLHMAIVNRDFFLAKFLIDLNAPVNEIACGKFFFPEDQKMKRVSNTNYEYVTVADDETDYEGFAYYGEYPLAFAACLEEMDICKLLIRHGAYINAKDANGNSVAHLTVIRNLPEMFDFALEHGADIYAKNNRGYNCLTLAAKMGNKEMVKHILELERKPYWTFGEVSCAAYPLSSLDTIDTESGLEGSIDRKSVLNIVVTSDNPRHLDLLDGLIVEILEQKWALFARKKFYQHLITYIVYLIIFNAAFILRPPFQPDPGTSHCVARNDTRRDYFLCPRVANGASKVIDSKDIGRLILELLTAGGSLGYLGSLIIDFNRQGFHIVFQSLVNAPTRFLFLLSCALVTISIPGLFICALTRGFRLVGPFVLMIGKMIKGDLLKFMLLYLIFLIAFSQAMVVSFAGTGGSRMFLNSPLRAIEGMFILSLGEFEEIEPEFDKAPHPIFVKILFVFYVVIANVLLVNMLIAMMGKTYETTVETRKEWKRQWAQTVLVIETSIKPKQRLQYQEKYSEALGDGHDGRAVVMRWQHDEIEKKRDHKRKIRKLNELADLLYKKDLEKRKNNKIANTIRNAINKGKTKPPTSNLESIRGKNLEMKNKRADILATVTNPGMILQATTRAGGSRPVSPQQNENTDNDASHQIVNPEEE
ncbi:uncharacterized protein TRIADDRAFT_58478 [Trichoplax adhaerens]|uniref:Ion transport domain-containing protein n=1 Tax=Trichoplax adhaerens TaxID=10228 RepID=B3S2T9_TRIAD|nr:hypothetical protein TRIADDRAFT_58478 [Trichoplax adhaerens]EDV22847.1 hypothetical protein TRIADDRAFT_58478 [Trichoplax adhaerens]|eukprot:XP_002114713.1 hypothetical protein TRIADDRAFT_58478 [Trichoplax adhaerens]